MILHLGSMLLDCPDPWINFIEELQHTVPEEEQDDGFTTEYLNERLAPFKATYERRPGNNQVDFATEKHYTMFILRYGAKR